MTAARQPSPTPIALLELRLQAMEAAVLVCRATPGRKAVHTLRGSIRSVEAALALLARLKGVPDLRAEAQALLDATAPLRRRAGRVRDMDVFETLLKAQEAEIVLDADDTRRAHEDCRALRKAARQRRKRAARRLVKAVEEQGVAVAEAAEALRHVLKPARDLRPGVTEIARIAERQFQTLRELKLPAPTDDDRHAIRKAAKRARLQLEFAGSAPRAVAAAERFHALQEAGGEWHDWLELTALAVKELGPHRATTRAIAARRDRRLRAFEQRLPAFRPVPKPRRRTQA